MDGTAPVHPPRVDPSERETQEIVLAEVGRDSDADGWTDIEERVLGMDPDRDDSDDDGLPDGEDRAPLLRPSAAAAVSPADAEILRAAIFGAFGLTESRWVLFARDDRVARVEVPALSAPVLFHRPLPANALMQTPGGVFVSWRIVRRSAGEAVVELTDWEGNLAAGGQEVFLRRISNRWFVVGWQTTWIS